MFLYTYRRQFMLTVAWSWILNLADKISKNADISKDRIKFLSIPGFLRDGECLS